MSDTREAEIMACLPAVGESYRLNYGEGNHANKLIHVRAVIDGEWIAFCYWKRGEWVYRLTDVTFFYVNMTSGVMTRVKGNA